jgi:2-succinyl-5-enolpyruvyl-6-hydroxy-3-cyclohexene-1-carboxylate synthase
MQGLPINSQLQINHSSAIRYATYRHSPTIEVYCNRGTRVGSTSTAIGAAVANAKPTFLLQVHRFCTIVMHYGTIIHS